MLAMLVVGLDEGLFSNEQVKNRHSTATDMLIRSRGSLKNALAATPNTEPFFIAIQFTVGKCHFSNKDYLDSVKEIWKVDLLAILRALKPLCPTTYVPWQDKDRPPESWAQLQARMIKFSIDVGSSAQPPQSLAQAMQLSLFLELAWTMLHFADATEMMMDYFQRLEFFTNGMLIGGGSGHPAYELRCTAVGPAFSRARRDVITTWCLAELLDSDADISEIQIRALKMFQYLEIEGRGLVMDRLAQWLTAGPPDEGHSLLSEAELGELEEQIARTWIRANGNVSRWW